MEEHSSLSTSGEETIYTLEGCSEVNPIAMLKNKYGNIVYIGNIKNNYRDGYGIQFDGNQYFLIALIILLFYFRLIYLTILLYVLD